MKVYIRANTNYYTPVLYVLRLIEKNQKIHFDIISTAENAYVIWDHLSEKTQPICTTFYDDLAQLKLHRYFQTNTAIYAENRQKDVMATIFYMVNCLQEMGSSNNDLDQYGRFRYEISYQNRLNCVEENLVQKEIDDFIIKLGLTPHRIKSTFFISHDIDSMYSSLFQDGLWALKRLKIGTILKLITKELLRNPNWKNIDRILKMNNEYEIRSTFFWLVNQGRGLQDIPNADYNIRKEAPLLKLVEESQSFNGLHKSSSGMSIDEEFQKGNINSPYNRYHFLKFSIPRDWNLLSKSKMKLDCSLGFAEHYGFRNSYGKSFQPFNIEENKPYDFVETPLTIMDTTLRNYMRMSPDKYAETITNFYEKNNYNCHISLLWHNSSFTDYKFGPLLNEYKKLIRYIWENKIGVITPAEIIEENTLAW